MKKANFDSTACWLLLLAPFFSNTLAHSGFAPVEWSPEILPPEQCGLEITHDLSEAIAIVAQLVKNNDTASSIPKSCMEIKENSSVSPSGYYTISNGNGGSVVVYCNMDELYSCPSLEQTLKGFSNTLSGFANTVTGVSSTVTEVASTLTGVSNNITGVSSTLEGVYDTLQTQSTCEKIASSCQEVWDNCPKCTSGNYKILTANFTEKYVYCDFEERCGIPGPWRRVAHLNMSDSSSVCPSGTQKFVKDSAIACGIQEPSNAKCVSITNSITHSYSQICGKVAGYQKASPDAFSRGVTDINKAYVDGISITRGTPRQHVWTYAIVLQENKIHDPRNPGAHICPCGATSTQQVPSFVGSDYYCESGCPDDFQFNTIYSNDVLWDGQQCGVLETDCCTIPNMPWFHKVLDTATSDGIEIRLCINQPTSDENVLVSLYDIYVK